MTDELAEDMNALGLSDEIADAPTEYDIERTTELYPVWADNLPALEIFLDLSSQWDFVAEADGELSRTRLRWESIEILKRNRNGLPRREWPKVFNDLLGMERAALRAMADERSKRRVKREEERAAAAARQS